MTRRWAAGILPVLAVLSAPSPTQVTPEPRDARAEDVQGTVHVVWDADPRLREGGRRFFLVKSDGSSLELLPGSSSVADALEGMDRRSVQVAGVLVSGSRADEPELRVERVLESQGEAPTRAAASQAPEARDFVTILCRFADDPTEPFTPAAVEVVHGPTYPGARQYYAEVSRDPGIMAGSTVAGWYLLPSPRGTYVNDSASSTSVGLLAQDCAAAADSDVDFTEYYGVNIQVSGFLSKRTVPPYDPLSFGGSFTLSLDGATRSYGMTWLSGDHHDNYVVVTHEMGHALGWPHSSGRYGSEYDSRWDVMSVGYLRYEPPWGWLTIHTIAHHKRLAGWIPEERLWRPTAGATETATIVRSALPPAEGYLMADIPVAPGRSYTVEARLLAGHDQPLPAEAVVIHETVGSRAYVVDPDADGDPNDEGAIWLPGETFTDTVAGFSVAVEERVADGFRVTISRLAEGTCTVSLSASPTQAGSASVTSGGQTGTCGRTVTVLAAPAAGWTFTAWTVGSETVSTQEQYAVQVASDLTLVAHFEPSCAVQVSAAPPEGGTVAVTAGDVSGACGREVTVTATASTGWVFVDWREGGTQVANSPALTLVANAERALMAHFVRVDDLGARALETLFGVAGRLESGEVAALDRDGNRNGTFDVGDLVAFFDRHPELSPGALR